MYQITTKSITPGDGRTLPNDELYVFVYIVVEVVVIPIKLHSHIILLMDGWMKRLKEEEAEVKFNDALE
jgi:hypothetical protein